MDDIMILTDEINTRMYWIWNEDIEKEVQLAPTRLADYICLHSENTSHSSVIISISRGEGIEMKNHYDGSKTTHSSTPARSIQCLDHYF